jgi:hypothetical protein
MVAIGNRVSHPRFGAGKVRKINQQAGTVLIEWEDHRVSRATPDLNPSQSHVNLSSVSQINGHVATTPPKPIEPVPRHAVLNSPPMHASKAAQLRTIKLVFEIVAVLVTIVGGIVALVWRFK